MNQLQKLLREYADRRFAADKESSRFIFDTEAELMLFVRRLSEVKAEYMIYGTKIEVFHEQSR